MNASSVLALTEFSVAAHAEQINRTARALERNGFTVEVLDDAQAAVRPQVQALDRATLGGRIRQLTAYAGGAGQVIWIVGAQKIVANLAETLKRIETYNRLGIKPISRGGPLR